MATSYGGYDWLKSNENINTMANAINNAAMVQSKAAEKAANIARESADKTISFLKQQADVARQDLAPFRQAGVAGTQELMSMLGLRGQEAQAQAYENVLQGPETQQIMQFGVDAFEKTAAAQGMLRSGRSMESLFKLGQDIAKSQISKKQDMLFNMMQVGTQAAAGSAGVAQQLGQAVGQQEQYASSAAANAALSQGSLQAQAMLQTAQLNVMRPEEKKTSPLKALAGLIGGGIGSFALGGLIGGGLGALGGGAESAMAMRGIGGGLV